MVKTVPVYRIEYVTSVNKLYVFVAILVFAIHCKLMSTYWTLLFVFNDEKS
jgi:hypothetical protein